LEYFKIKDPNSDWYGSGVKFKRLVQSKEGKIWNKLNYLKAHLNQVEKLHPEALNNYDNWDVIKYTDDGIIVIGKVKDFR